MIYISVLWVFGCHAVVSLSLIPQLHDGDQIFDYKATDHTYFWLLWCHQSNTHLLDNQPASFPMATPPIISLFKVQWFKPN